MPDTTSSLENTVLRFPEGLPGFEEYTRFTITVRADLAPILFLNSVEDEQLSLPVIPVEAVKRDYRVQLEECDRRLLEIDGDPAPGINVVCLAVLVLSDEGRAPTCNLMAPIVVNPATVQAYRMIGYENRLIADEDFNDDKKDAGNLGAGHTVRALYEVIPVGVDTGLTGLDELKYQQSVETSEACSSNEILTVKVPYKQPDAAGSQLLSRPVPFEETELASMPEDFRFAAAVAEFGMLLRDSPHKAAASYEQVLELADGSETAQSDDPRFEFLYLVRTAWRLSAEQTVSQLVSP